MDPVEIIRADHRKVEALFEEYEALGDDAYMNKAELVATIIEELERHAEMEETIAYPAFLEAFSDEDDKKVEEGYAEHDVIKNLMEELKTLDPEDPQFEAKVTVLDENVSHHVEEEEAVMLPKAEEEVPAEEMERIGQEMMAYKDALEDGAADPDEDDL